MLHELVFAYQLYTPKFSGRELLPGVVIVPNWGYPTHCLPLVAPVIVHITRRIAHRRQWPQAGTSLTPCYFLDRSSRVLGAPLFRHILFKAPTARQHI